MLMYQQFKGFGKIRPRVAARPDALTGQKSMGCRCYGLGLIERFDSYAG